MTTLETARQIAERWQVSEDTVIEWVRTGRIPEIRISRKVRRFDPEAVDRALRGDAVSEGSADGR